MMRKMKRIVSLLLIVIMVLAPMSALAAETVRILKVNGDYVHLRSESGYVMTSLRKGTKLLYWGESKNGMLKVRTSGGSVGYVYKAYVSTYGVMKKSAVYRTVGATKLYKLSGSKLKTKATLSSGTYVCVYKKSGGWAYVKTMSGSSGYCLTSALKKAF